MTTPEHQLEEQLIEKLQSLKYEYRPDILVQKNIRGCQPAPQQYPQERADAAAFPIPGGG
jgi:hypothetical protein